MKILDNYLEIFLSGKYPLIGLFLIFFIITFYWNTIFKFFDLKVYDNIQRVHKDETSRTGGLIIYLFLWGIFFFDYFKDNLFSNILISSAPFVLISLKEDLFHNTDPKNRLILMVLSCFIFFYINPIDFPFIDIPYIGKIISIYPLAIIFFTFSVLIVMNGMNLIDGMNGLLGFVGFFILFGLATIAINLGDIYFARIVIIFSIPLVIFLFFNFPLGKVFMGDLGAYFYGFTIAILTIYFFGINQHLHSWLAVLILIYPCFELLFSFVRKIKNQKSPLKPDDLHMHTLIFKLLNNVFEANLSNPLTTLALFNFWLIPYVLTISFYNQLNFIILSIVAIIFLYYLIYCTLNYFYFKHKK